MVWAAGVRYVMPARIDLLPQAVPWGWLPALALVPATVGALGFFVGWRHVAARRRRRWTAGQNLLSLATGWALPWLLGLLLPLFAALRAGVWRLLVGCVLGSLAAAAMVNRLPMRLAIREVI